jgi:hypothetical protein
MSKPESLAVGAVRKTSAATPPVVLKKWLEKSPRKKLVKKQGRAA